MSVNVLYRTSAKATGGRDGHAATLDGTLDVKLTTPKELGGGGGAGNNPEQLFAAGYAACFIGAMKFVASQGGPKVPADASVTSKHTCPGDTLVRSRQSTTNSRKCASPSVCPEMLIDTLRPEEMRSPPRPRAASAVCTTQRSTSDIRR